MRSIASAPAMVMTMAMTIASRGRSTKTAEIMAQCPQFRPTAASGRAREDRSVSVAGWSPRLSPAPAPPLLACGPGLGAEAFTGPGGGSGVTCTPGRTRWMPSTTTISPSVSPRHYDGRVGRRLAELDAALLRPVLAIHDIDVVALLVGQHRGAGHAESQHRLDALDQHGDELSVGQRRFATSPGRSGPHFGLAITARIRIVSVFAETVGSM